MDQRRQHRLGLLAFYASAAIAVAAVGSAGQVMAGAAASQAATCTELVQNGGFEAGAAGWQQASAQGFQLINGFNPRTGALGADLGGANNADDRLSQAISLPPDARLTLTAWWSLATAETAGVFDTLTVALVAADGAVVATLATLDNTATPGVWEELTLDVSPHAGQSLVLRFAARTDQEDISEFFLDDISLWACPFDATPTPTATVSVATATPTATASATSIPPARRLYLPVILK